MLVNALADGSPNDGEHLRKSIKRVRTGCVTCRSVIPVAMLTTPWSLIHLLLSEAGKSSATRPSLSVGGVLPPADPAKATKTPVRQRYEIDAPNTVSFPTVGRSIWPTAMPIRTLPSCSALASGHFGTRLATLHLSLRYHSSLPEA